MEDVSPIFLLSSDMQTRLPHLPYVNYGKAIPDSIHSSARANPRSHPRTDLKELVHWDSFPDQIHEAILSAMTSRDLVSEDFDIHGLTDDTIVECEETIRAHAMFALHTPVQRVVNKLGLQGTLRTPGSGNSAIVGSPDFSWIIDALNIPPPILVVEYKPWWVVDLVRVLAAFDGTACDSPAEQTLEALDQIYGYMTFNNNKFGILTSWTHALFLRRAETPDRKCLEYYIVELEGLSPSISMLKAWVGIVLLAHDDWFHASPILCDSPPSFGTSATGQKAQQKGFKRAEEFNMTPANGTYKRCTLDFRLCEFDLSSARERAGGCIVWGRLLQSITDSLDTVFKVVDACRYPDAPEVLQDEADVYAALYNLQGQVIPKVYGLYEVWGILQILALQPVGIALSDQDKISRVTLKKMKSALQSFHDAGFLHGDITRRNFCRSKNGDVFLVDLMHCRPSADQAEMADEMAEVDALEHV